MSIIILLAPGLVRSQTFQCPSGNSYTSDANGLIYNVNSADLTFLLNLGARIASPRNNFSGSGAPGGSNDASQLFDTGSIWVFGSNVYINVTGFPLGSASWTLLATSLGSTLLGSLTGTTRAVTTNFTITNTDKGNTVYKPGGTAAQVTGTLAAAGTLDANWQVRVSNQDSRALFINNNGGTRVYALYPNQDLVIMNQGGTLTYSPPYQRWNGGGPLGAGITINVDFSSGNDSNDGLGVGTGNAMATALAAFNFIRDHTDAGVNSYTIQLVPGQTINSSFGEFDGDKAGGFGKLVQLAGDPTMANLTLINCPGSSACVTLRDGAWVQFNGVQFGSSGSGSTGANLTQKSLGDIGNCQYGSMVGGNHVSVADGADCNIVANESIVLGGASAHWLVEFGGKLLVGTVTINGNGDAVAFSNGFVLGDADARIEFQAGLTFSGTGSLTGFQYALTRHSFLLSNGITPPGSAGGTVDGTSNFY